MNALEAIIRDAIDARGAMTIAAYMEMALQHPQYGYYRVREPVGRAGDFVTAPEVSQMFGEMIGMWCAQSWKMLGCPSPFALVELGPGCGTMMRDILRATAHVGGFHDAMQLFLIDSDAALRDRQREALADRPPRYIETIGQLPSMPAMIVANEFFDALPVRQFEMTFQGWAERVVVVGEAGLGMALRPVSGEEAVLIPPAWRDARPGAVFEISPAAQGVMRDVAARLVRDKGAMLVVDYGYAAPPGYATVQAVSRHERADIFDRPGEVDLTAHVDFTALAGAARAAGAAASDIVGQGMFLKNLGIDIRADMLKKRATLPQTAAIDCDLERLVSPDKMGELFKVIEVRG
ncbi:MAG: SAM-dependent methyltransferase [Alphaproteobacteria bacterium]|nr:SAM-dependent methyltransferase [Alphaproteobacteria bacterium]